MAESSINDRFNSSISTFDGTVVGLSQITIKPKSDQLSDTLTGTSYELPSGAIFGFVSESRMILSDS